MKIGILNTDTLKTEFDTKYGQYPAMFSKVLQHAAPKIEIYSYEVQTGEYPDELNECDAYLITGSKVSAYDDLPWIVELKNFIRTLHQHQKKLVGICFGADSIWILGGATYLFGLCPIGFGAPGLLASAEPVRVVFGKASRPGSSRLQLG